MDGGYKLIPSQSNEERNRVIICIDGWLGGNKVLIMLSEIEFCATIANKDHSHNGAKSAQKSLSSHRPTDLSAII